MDKKQVRTLDYILGLILGITGIIFFIAFMGVDAYMFGINPPSWTRSIENNIFLQPLWLDVLSTIMLIAIILLIFIKPSKPTRVRKR
jgi:hypothetical protein